MLYRFPETGISLQYWIMDPHKRLGNQLGLVFYLHKHLIRKGKFSMLYRISIGPGYVEKRFNLYTNNENNLISSRMNFVLNGRFLIKYRISPEISFQAGLGIVHFSNGGLKMPNQGINIPSVHIGTAYHFRETVQKVYPRPAKLKRHLLLQADFAGGSKNDYPIGSGRYPVSTLELRTVQVLNYKSSLTFGPDLFYDGSLRIHKDSLHLEGRKDYLKAGIAFGHDLNFGRFAMVTQIGYMYFDPAKLLSPVYQRYGLRFYLTENLSAMVAMKAHLGRADFVEWSLGYKTGR
jgi:hypothetical protein